MTTLLWILASGVLMSLIALVGSVTLAPRPATSRELVLPLVALATGSLLGGAVFPRRVVGFVTFLALLLGVRLALQP